MQRADKLRTLWLTGILHAFTHFYQVALLPLYILIQKDLKLATVDQATFLVTAMMLAYFAPSYFMGALADKFSKKKLLALGLAVNGAAFAALSMVHSYWMAVFWIILAGFGGSFFHPSATALIARAFPDNTGKALGLVGMGASIGFFLGPIFCGWRAEASGSWRTPTLELGLAGVVTACLFAWLGKEEPAGDEPPHPHSSPKTFFSKPALIWVFLFAAAALSLRDFTGSAMGSLGSLFLQKAHKLTTKETGGILSAIFLASAISNPLFGSLSDKGRIRWTTFVLVIAASMVAIFPRVPVRYSIAALAVYGFFFMASYPILEAALMSSVRPSVRGRVFGLFITIGGMGNLAHWITGNWVRNLGARAGEAASYYHLYNILSLFILLSMTGLPALHLLGKSKKLTPAPA
jgi:MFS family permease